MKKTILLALALTSLVTLKAQWVNNPVNNTFLANCNGTHLAPMAGVKLWEPGLHGGRPTLHLSAMDYEIVDLLHIYNMNGQCIKVNDLNELSRGIYILQGLTKNGLLVSRKTLIERKE